MSSAFQATLNLEDGHDRDALLIALLTGAMAKGVGKSEVVALLRAALSLDGVLDRRKLTLQADGPVVGVAGSGKKGTKTFNVSTLSSLVAATGSVTVVKAGSYATSSVSGARDFMISVGFPTEVDLAEISRVVSSLSFGFFSIEALVPKFDAAYGGRFYAPTPLSFGLPALVIPAEVDVLLYGLAHPNVTLSLEVLREFNLNDALVVSSTHNDVHFLDEMGVFGTTRIQGSRSGHIGRVRFYEPTEMLDLPRYTPRDIAEADTLKENVKRGLAVLRGEGERPLEDIVAINAANILLLGRQVGDVREGYWRAKEIMKNAQAIDLLEAFIQETSGDLVKLRKLLSDVRS